MAGSRRMIVMYGAMLGALTLGTPCGVAAQGGTASGTANGATAGAPPSGARLAMLPTTTRSASARALVARGQRAMDVGRPALAFDYFERATRADSGYAFAWLQRAVNAPTLAGYRDGLARAVSLEAGASPEERLLIELQRQAFDGDPTAQLATARELVRLAPRSPRAYVALSEAQSALRHEADARQSLKSALELSPRFVPAHIGLVSSWLFVVPKDLTLAERQARALVAAEPKESMSYQWLGDALRAQGKLTEAAAAYTTELRLDPSLPDAWVKRGNAYAFLRRYDAARADYDSGSARAKTNDGVSYRVSRALVNVHAGDPATALAELSRLEGGIDGLGVADPDAARLAVLRAELAIALHTRQLDSARQALDRFTPIMLKQGEASGSADYQREAIAQTQFLEGSLLARRGDYAGARTKAQEFMRTVAPSPTPTKNEPAHELMGLADLLEGNYASAAEHFAEADPNDPYVQYHHALALEGAGQRLQARALFTQVAHYYFNNPRAALVRREAEAKVRK